MTEPKEQIVSEPHPHPPAVIVASLQIHPIDEVVRFLRCNGTGFLKFLFYQSESASHHEK